MLHFDLSSKRDGSAAQGQTSAVLLKLLQQAQQTGTLNLSNRSLEAVPTTVWNLNEPLPSPDGAAVVDLKRPSDGPRWWELQPITKLILTSNRITRIPGTGLVKLDTLTHLDLRDNQLVELPTEIGELCALKALVL
ncbi:leucine-rich repeat-containing protein 40, partial [Clonorchis sinensis]